MDIAMSNAELREKEAEAKRIEVTAQKTQAAKALEDSYEAERLAEIARATREKATLEADVIIKTQIEKQRLELEAEAEAEQVRRRAAGEADAIYIKMQAEARGMEEILSKQAEGFTKIINAAGGSSQDAIMMLIADKLEDLMKVQVEAIKNVKIDKVTVWDSGANADGKNSTAGFLSGLMKSVPPLEEVFALSGMKLPSYLGTKETESIGDKTE